MTKLSPWLVGLLAATFFFAACAGEEGSEDLTDTAVADTTPDVDPDAEGDTSEETSEDVADEEASEEVDTGDPSRCTTNEECDDGLSCTTDTCSEELGHCVWEIVEDTCLIGAECWVPDDSSSRAPCGKCDPAVSQTEWTPRANGESCNSTSFCVADAVCQEGECVGEPITCDDGNPCTNDSCEDALGCVFEADFDGVPCDDNSVCTLNDRCLAGECTGTSRNCDDGNVCTDDSCDPVGGCENPPNTAPCDDGNACTVGDVCAEGFCTSGGPRNCEDGNSCTIDTCEPGLGCAYLPTLNPCCEGSVSICDDGNPCTTDICDPTDFSCSYDNNSAICDDDNLCTSNDTCSAGACGGEDTDCDDGNPCSANFCDPETGCDGEALHGIPCDDGIDCTFEEMCVTGTCVPGRNECFCIPETFGKQAVKITSMRIGDGGHPGEALDLDGNPATCSPTTNCSGGVHNALGAIAPFANESLAESVTEGSLMLVFEIDDIGLNPFELAFHQGELASTNPTCDFQANGCDYVLSDSGFDPVSCERVITLSATRAGTAIRAGGRGTVFPFDIPLGDSVLTITLYDVILDGRVTIAGDEVIAFEGILGGAVPRDQLVAAIRSLDPDSLPTPPEQLISLLNVLVKDDIDTDGDGTPDAASIGIPISAVGANIVGVE